MRSAVLLLVVVLLAGCSVRPAARPVPTPPAPSMPATTGSPGQDQNAVPSSGPDATPAPAAAAPVPLEIWGTADPRYITGSGEHRLTVSTGRFWLQARVHAATEDAAVAAVAITGAEPLWPAETRREGKDSDLWHVMLTLADGAPGDVVTVAVTPGQGLSPVTAQLTRKAPPTVTILLQAADGTWAPIWSGVSLPPGPKRLRLQTTGGLSVDALRPVYESTDQQIFPDRTTRIAADLLEVEFTNPPPLVQVMVTGGADADGLVPPLVSGHFYIGEPPSLVAADLAKGTFETIGTAPPDLSGFPVLSKDGRYLAFTTLIPEATYGQQVWLADLKTGTLTRTPFQYEDGAGPGFDAQGRLIALAGPGRLGVMDPKSGKAEVIKTAATFWSWLSPDGRYIAGRVGPPPGRSTGAWVGPPRAYGLVVRDLLTDTEHVFEWNGYGQVDWLPDGRLLLGTASTNEYPGDMQLFTVNPVSGDRTPYAGQWPQRPVPTYAGHWAPGDRPLATLPDGRVLLYRWSNSGNARRAML